MPTSNSKTTWRDKPIAPRDYTDVAHCVEVARKARGRIVEFDWSFSGEDLRRLRRAVFEWGGRYGGRYRCFDARLLAAINDALNEQNSLFVRSESRNSAPTDCSATCVSHGEAFRVRGYAPFDIVFLYGSAAVSEGTPASLNLGPIVQETLANAVGMLGWDLRQLQEERFRPVRNVLYGNAVGYGISPAGPPTGPATDFSIHFQGPFHASDGEGRRCLFAEEIKNLSGIYLWTITVDARERLWYVGQTRRGFGRRLGEHLACFLSGQYTPYDAAALSRGVNERARGAPVGSWPDTLPSFLGSHERMMPNVISLIRLMNVHVAPLTGDAHLHDRVEGAIGRHYQTHKDADVRNFFFPGVRVPAAIPFDNPLRLVLSSDVPIVGLPTHILT